MTDSVADIPDSLVKEWGIIVVPCYVNIGDKSLADDGVELVREDYYEQLGSMNENPTTSAMPPGVALEYMQPILDDAEHIIVITTPAKLSGIHNAFRLALEQSGISKERYTLIDSGMVSLGMAFQVMAGIEIAAETGDVAKTIEMIHRTKEHTCLYATIGSMEFLRRSGRVGWAAAGIAGLLNIKPVIQVDDGDVHAIARVRTFNRALDKMVELVREASPIDRLGLMHINYPEGMEDVRTRLADVIPEGRNVITGMIGPTVGTHIGPGSLGVVAVRQGWRG